MPQRTNQFQGLVKRIETALHDVDVDIKESALVTNYRSGKKDEIDVLVTFSMAGREFRTAISVRDRGRKGNPDWIRALRSQRD